MGLLDLDNDTAAMIGMSLLGGGDNALMPLMMMDAFGGNDMAKSMGYGFNQPSNQSSSSGGGSLSSDQSTRLQQLKSQAEAAFPDDPVRQQVAITQAIHESGLMGHPSKLATESNNYFGIKAPGSAGTTNMRTGEYTSAGYGTTNADFGKNSSVEDSFMQYRNLMNKPRYNSVLSATNPHDAFNALQRSGYATDPRYANNLDKVYNQYVAPLY